MNENEEKWAVILEKLYEWGVTTGPGGEPGFPEDLSERIAEETNMEKGDVSSAVSQMEEWGLLEVNDVPISGEYDANLELATEPVYGLSKRGFDVAHDLEMKDHEQTMENRRAKQQHDVNRAVAFLTLALVAIGTLDMVVRAQVGASAPEFSIYLTALAGSVIFLFMVVLNGPRSAV